MNTLEGLTSLTARILWITLRSRSWNLKVITITTIAEFENEIARQKAEHIKKGSDPSSFRPDFYWSGFYYMNSANFQGVSLKGACFRNVKIDEANLRGANLSGVDFREADISESDLSGSNMSGCNFESANLYKSNMSYSILVGACLLGADLGHTYFTGADLRGAIFTPDQIIKSVFDLAIINHEQFKNLAKIYSQDFLSKFIVKN